MAIGMTVAMALAAAVMPAPKVWAAPIPGLSTLIAPKPGFVGSPLGFEVSAGDSRWQQQKPAGSESAALVALFTPSAQAKNQSDRKTTASLSVRVDTLVGSKKNVTLEAYANHWSREFPKYGFDILGTQAFLQGTLKGYVIDMVRRESHEQMRQVIFLKNTHAVIFTCRDSVGAFAESLKSCNSIVRTFRW